MINTLHNSLNLVNLTHNQPLMSNSHLRIDFAKKVYIVTLLLVSIWCFFILLTPLLVSTGGILSEIGYFMYIFYSPTCHQEELRSFILFGEKFAVCSRCTTIYFSFLLGTLVYPFTRKITNVKLPSIWFLVAACIVMVADVSLDLMDVLKNTYLTRSISGGVLGFVLAFYIIPGFINFTFEVASFLKNDSKNLVKDSNDIVKNEQ